MESGEIKVWDKILDKALSTPMIRVDRNKFLKQEFTTYGQEEFLVERTPVDLYSDEILDKVAAGVINSHLRLATSTSFLAGLPGGYAAWGTIPVDIVQFYGHALVLAQKLAYIYGWSSFCDENGEIDSETRSLLTLFMGVMMGSQAACKGLFKYQSIAATAFAKRLAQKSLTKTSYYPLVKQVGKWIGIQVTKGTFAKGVSKIIPLIGGGISGALTYFTLKPMAIRLKEHFKEQVQLKRVEALSTQHTDAEVDYEEIFYVDVIDVDKALHDFEKLKIQACMNMAKIDNDFCQEERDFIKEQLEQSKELTDSDKEELKQQVESNELVTIDLSILKNSDLYAFTFIELLISIIKIDGRVAPSEKLYLMKLAKELDINKEDIEGLLAND